MIHSIKLSCDMINAWRKCQIAYRERDDVLITSASDGDEVGAPTSVGSVEREVGRRARMSYGWDPMRQMSVRSR